jgi:hypothetical protein
MAKYHMITFFSQGPPHDKGLNLQKAANSLEQKYVNYVDSFTKYSPKVLKNMGHPLVDYSAEYQPENNQGYPATGFGYWRPLIIFLKLQEIENGDILFQQDCNVEKNPQFLNLAENVKNFANLALKNRDFFIAHHHHPAEMRFYVKGDLIDKITGDDFDWYLNKPMFRISHFLCRKTDVTMKIVKEWLDLCTPENLIPPSIKIYDKFDHHTMEQAVLNLIIYKYIRSGYLTNIYLKEYNVFHDLGQVYQIMLRE